MRAAPGSNWSSKVNRLKKLSPGLRQKKTNPDPKIDEAMPETSFQSKRKDNLATETKSPVKPQLVRGSGPSSQPRANK